MAEEKSTIEAKTEEKKAELVRLNVDGLQWAAGSVSQGEDDSEERVYQVYEKMLEENKEFDIRFATASSVGNLSLMDGNVRIRMRPKEMDGPVWSTKTRSIMKEGRRYTTMMLARTYRVRVVKVDRTNKSVFVSERAAHADLKERVIDKISELLKSGKHAVVPARVIGTCPSMSSLVMVSVGDLGIPGVIRKENWARTYVSNLTQAAVPGKMISVAVTGTAKWSDRYGINAVDLRSTIFECSRAETITEDPWKGVEEHYPVNSGVRVRCMNVSYGRFFASIDGLEDINAVCVVKEDENGPIVTPQIGREYLGYVYMVDEKKHHLKIRIIGEVPAVETEEETENKQE